MKKRDTSWGGVADWYDDYLKNEDSYQTQVVLPNLIRILSISKGETILDIACGQGFFASAFTEAGATVTGADIAKPLIEKAIATYPRVTFHVAPAHQLTFAANGTYDSATCILAIQNIEHMSEVFAEAARVLKKGGRLILVLNHPAFRIPKRSHWGFNSEKSIQYRRLDGYLSGSTVEIEMHPGKDTGEKTISYHRSLQEIMKALAKNGFAITRLEEWISHKKSEPGPRQKAEDLARKEFPLFLMLEARSLQ